MDRKFLLGTLCFIVFGLKSQVLNWDWARTVNGVQDEAATHLTQDPSGNLIVCGLLSSTAATIGATSLNNSGSLGTRDMLVIKYNNSGTVQWVKKSQGSGDEVPVAVSCDGAGNIYVAGNYDSPTMVVGTTTLNNSSSFNDMFVLKYDPSGILLWARSYGGNLLEEMRSLKCDNSGNCYITGSFRSLSVNFGSYGVVNSGNSDAFIAKIDNAGTVLWAKQIGGSQNDNGVAVTTDGAGNVFLMGNYDSSTLGTYTVNNAGGSDIFLGRYDATTGSLINTRTIGGTQNESAWRLVANTSGVYAACSFQSTNLNLGIVTLNNGSLCDMLIMKLNNTLATQWAFRYNGNFDSNVSDLFIENTGNVLLSGNFDLGSLTLGATTLTNPSTLTEGYIMRCDPAGTILMAKSTSASGAELITGVCSDISGSIFVAGDYDPVVTLGNIYLSGLGGSELFLAKLCVQPAAPQLVSSVSVCARQAAVINASVTSGISVNWYSAATGGNILLTGSNTFSTFNSGTYYAGAVNGANGCNSSSRASVTVSVQSAPDVTISGTTLTASFGTAFKWLECNKDSLLPGVTSQTYTVVKTGYYAAIVTNNGCTDTSTCKFYSVNPVTGTVTVPPDTVKSAIAEQNESGFFTQVYPNPSKGSITIKADKKTSLTLYDISGRQLFIIDLDSNNSYSSNIEALPIGLYFLVDEKHQSRKLVVSSD